MKPSMNSFLAALIACSFALTGCDIVGDMTVNDIIEAAEEAAREQREEQGREGDDDAPDIQEPIDHEDDEGEEPCEGEDPFEGEDPLEEDWCESTFQACLEGFDEPEEAGPEEAEVPALPADEDGAEIPEDEEPVEDDAMEDDPLAICFEMLEACKEAEEQEDPIDDLACEMAVDAAMVCGEDLDVCLDAVDEAFEEGPDPMAPEADEEAAEEGDGPVGACFDDFDACESEIIGDVCGQHEEDEGPWLVCEQTFEECTEAAANEDDFVACEQDFEVCVEDQWGPELPLDPCDEDLNLCLDAVLGIDGEDEAEFDEALIDVCFEAHVACINDGEPMEDDEVLPPAPPPAGGE